MTDKLTQRERQLVNWLHDQEAARVEVCGRPFIPVSRDYQIGRMTGYSHVAAAIERGEPWKGKDDDR